MWGWTILGALTIGIVAYLLLSGFLKTWRLYRGVRVITCPENHDTAAVRVDAFDAAKWFAVSGEADIHLRSCSRWPEMEGCDQACRNEINAAPDRCLLQNIVASWYAGKSCHYCRKEIGEIVWHERPPAVKMADGTIHEWKDLPAEKLPKVFAAGEPVCWACFMVETFRKDHPEMVVQRRHETIQHHPLPPSAATY
jgi:hypothetical protein